MKKFNQIAILGLGYIGLPTAAAFANAGVNVLGVDCNPEVVKAVNQARPHFSEPNLLEAVQQAVKNGKLVASTQVQKADAFIIAVPTPLNDFQPDLSYIENAIQAIAPVLEKGNLLVLESTVPVGTTEQIADWLRTARPDLRFPQASENGVADVQIAYCPERVLPSRIMHEIYHNDRIIGGLTPHCTEQAVALYRLFAKGECLPTNARTAEMCKLTENSFRDVNIAFANELSMICDEWQINVWELIRLANRHPRVEILQAGAGVGGHCIAVDPWFIAAKSPQAHLIRTARNVNDHKPQWVLEKVKATVADYLMAKNRSVQSLKIACFGLAFKADVDDLRESPAVKIVQQLAEWHQGELWVVEPNIQQLPANLAEKGVKLCDLETALTADILVLLVDHSPFKAVKKSQISTAYVVDTRGIWTE